MPMRYLIWILISFPFLTHAGRAEEPGIPVAPLASIVTVSTNHMAMAAEDVPVAVPEPDEKAVRLYRTGNLWWFVRMAWGLALPALLLFSGFSARLRNLARRIGRRWYFIIVCYFIMLALLVYGLNWPLDYCLGFCAGTACLWSCQEQTFGKWFGDSLKELAILIVAGRQLVSAGLPYWLLKKSPRLLYSGFTRRWPWSHFTFLSN